MKNILKILLILHLISVIGVIYTLTYNSWLTNYIMLNKFLNLEQIISENDILKLWIISIQCRYVITDIMAIRMQNPYLSNKLYTVKDLNKMLVKRYSAYHCLEGIICMIIFHHQRKYIFSFICFIWSILWSFALFSKRILLYLT